MFKETFLNIISSGLEIYFFPWESVRLASSAFAKITIKTDKINKKSQDAGGGGSCAIPPPA